MVRIRRQTTVMMYKVVMTTEGHSRLMFQLESQEGDQLARKVRRQRTVTLNNLMMIKVKRKKMMMRTGG